MGKARRLRRKQKPYAFTAENPLIVPTVRPKKLVIGMPMYWTPPYQTFKAAFDMVNAPDLLPPDTDVVVVNMPYIDFARNEIVKRAAQKGTDEVLFLDQDVVYPPDLYLRLARHNVPVVSGLYFNKTEPYLPLIYDWVAEDQMDTLPRLDYPEGLVRCGAVGMGATLIKMEAFEKVLQWQVDEGERIPMAFRQHAPIGEDIWFCKQAHFAGVEVYCDTSLKLEHVGLIAVTETFHKLCATYGSFEKVLDKMNELLKPQMRYERVDGPNGSAIQAVSQATIQPVL